MLVFHDTSLRECTFTYIYNAHVITYVNKNLVTEEKYLYKIDFACTNVVEQQPVKRPVVAIAVSHAHGWTRMKHTLERPMLANTTKTAKLQ